MTNTQEGVVASCLRVIVTDRKHNFQWNLNLLVALQLSLQVVTYAVDAYLVVQHLPIE